MTFRTSTHLRRLAFATLLAAAATFSGSAIGDPALACAEPREWDIGGYDDCMAYALAQYQTGKMTFQEYNSNVNTCCWLNGGVVSEDQLCVAPTGEQSQEAERAPVEPAIQPPEATLWMPPPQDPPMILYPGAITPGPASRG